MKHGTNLIPNTSKQPEAVVSVAQHFQELEKIMTQQQNSTKTKQQYMLEKMDYGVQMKCRMYFNLTIVE